MKKHFLYKAVSLITAAFVLAAGTDMTSSAELTNMEKMEQRRTLPVQSNSIENWPQGPAIGAQSAILMEMNTKTILYAKNIDEKSYPASTTKILTALIAMQNCTMDETVTFSHDAIYDVPTDGSKLGGVDTGDTILMEHALYSVLVRSANEVANAVGEHVAKKLGEESFPEVMNKKAKELGCKGSNFVNANGLYSDNHYTTAYDLALIGCEFFNNELLCRMSSTSTYHFKLKPDAENDAYIASKNQLFKGKPYEYKYLLGSKTGFVSQSRQTLVSGAEKNGMKLVCVVFCEETPYQFEDTVTLFQYGFENFQKISVNDNEEKYKILADDLFNTGNDPFGDSTPLISMENDSYVILPNTASFSDMASTLKYDNTPDNGGVIATVNYTYSDVPVGSCNIIFSKTEKSCFSFSLSEPIQEISHINREDESSEDMSSADETVSNKDSIIFINVKKVIFGVLIFAGIVLIIFIIVSVANNYSFSLIRHHGRRGKYSKRRNHRRRIRKPRRRREKRH